jgi:hypothetical protein
MNKTISKILIGISAIFAAGVLSFVPGKTAKATVASYYPVTELYVIDPSNNITTINNCANWTFSNIDFTSTSIDTNAYSPTGQTVVVMIDGAEYACVAEIAFTSAIPDNATATVSFNFTYNGNNISRSVLLTKNAPNELSSDWVYGSFSIDNTSEFARSINAKVNDIDMAFKGLNPDGTVNETKTVEYNYNYAINEKIIEKLAQADGVTLLYTFEYEGYVFTSTITSEDAAKIFSKDIPWYGPCYIASNCPTVMVGVAE